MQSRERLRDVFQTYLTQRSRHKITIIIDTCVLIASAYAAVAYAVAEGCCVRGSSPEQAISLPNILVFLCVVADVIVGALVFRFYKTKLTGYSKDDNGAQKCVHRVIVALCIVITQQLLLLLELFTFFREVSFFFVFSPLIAFLIALVVHWNGPAFLIWGVMTPTVVLLMFKADRLLGIGTDHLIGHEFPEFSWMMIMMPIWIVILMVPVCYCTQH